MVILICIYTQHTKDENNSPVDLFVYMVAELGGDLKTFYWLLTPTSSICN